MRYDLLILGHGPEARKTAQAAADRDWLVALIEDDGAAEAVSLDVIRAVAQRVAGQVDLTAASIAYKLRTIAAKQRAAWNAQLAWSGVDCYRGHARFLDARSVSVETADDFLVLDADRFLVANGSRTARPSYVPFNGRTVITAEELPILVEAPDSMILVGAAAYGMELANLLASADVRVQMTRSEAEVLGIEETADGAGVRLHGGRLIRSQLVVFNAARQGRAEELHVEAAGLLADEHGRLWCDERFRTWADHIFACSAIEEGIECHPEAVLDAMGDTWPATPKHDRLMLGV